jgi:hypothetical protein
MVKEVELPEGKRLAKRAERKAHKTWLKERTVLGLPPWITKRDDWTEGRPEVCHLRSSKTLRQWSDEYCASEKYLKEFVYQKVRPVFPYHPCVLSSVGSQVIYGWNIQNLEHAIRSSIIAAGYRGRVEIKFITHGSKIYVRSNNAISRMLSNKWLKFLSILLLLYPFIWLFKRFHSRGGGRWEVCGGAYTLKRRAPVEEGQLPFGTAETSPGVIQTPAGIAGLVGGEAEWFMKWEGFIVRAVLGNYQSSMPIFDTDHVLDANLRVWL